MDEQTKTNLFFSLKIVGIAYMFVIVAYIGMFAGWDPRYTQIVGAGCTVAFIVLVAMDYVNAVRKISEGHPVRLILLTGLNTFKEVDTAVIDYKLVDQKTEKILDVKLREDEPPEKIPIGRFVYEVSLISPVTLEFGEKETKARKAIIICPAPFKYVFMPYSQVELMTLRNIMRMPAARIVAEVIDYEEDEPKPVLLVVDSAFHSMMRRMNLEFPEFSKEDILEGIRQAHIQNIIALKGELEAKDSVLKAQSKIMKTVEKEAKKLAVKLYEIQNEKLTPIVSFRAPWAKIAIAFVAGMLIVLVLIRFGVIPR